MFSELIVPLANFMVHFISAAGYFGVFVLMTLESMVFPVPSELVMPFAGFLVSTGRFSLLLAAFVGALGSILGSLLSYAMGYYGGRGFVRRFGRYLLLNEHDLETTENWFKNKGELTIFVSRFIPVVRHLISVPAGIGKMNLGRFVVYTFFGAFFWCLILTYVGFVFGENWQAIKNYTEPLSFIVLLLLAAGFIYFVCRHIARR